MFTAARKIANYCTFLCTTAVSKKKPFDFCKTLHFDFFMLSDSQEGSSPKIHTLNFNNKHWAYICPKGFLGGLIFSGAGGVIAGSFGLQKWFGLSLEGSLLHLHQKECRNRVEELNFVANTICMLPRNTRTVLRRQYDKNKDRTI